MNIQTILWKTNYEVIGLSKSKLNGKVNPYIVGNFTKGAVKNFEKNIVDQTDYLEKVDVHLKDKEK